MIKIGKIDAYKEFLPLGRLYKKFISLAGKENVFEIGRSKQGEKIICGTIGAGKKAALIFAYPHPNEPVGSLTCLSWVKILKKNPDLLKKYTWYIVPCADPDGARLNEGWFKGVFSIKKYVYNFYRQIGDQTDWSFPVSYKKYSFNKPTKQTKALIKLIDKTKPSIVYSLHNSSFSGAYFLQTKELDKTHLDAIEMTCKKLSIPLHKGGPEVPFAKEFRPAFYKLFDIKEEYDFLEGVKQDPLKRLIGGSSSATYAKSKNKNSFSLVCEIPYLYDKSLSDSRLSKVKKIDALKMQLSDNETVKESIVSAMKTAGLNKKSLFYKLNKENLKIVSGLIASQKAMMTKVPDGCVTNAELFHSKVIHVFYRTLFLGELRRLLLDSSQTVKMKQAIKELEQVINRRIAFVNKHSDYRVIPITSLVKFQIIYLVEALKRL
jgi:hypothetical protein